MKNVTVITGGVGGMGFAMANSFGRQGPVLLCDINEDKLESSVATLVRQNIEAYYAVADVSKQEQVQAALEKALSLGKLRNVIHTAGVSPIQVSHLEEEKAKKLILDVNVLGTIYMVESFLPALEEGSAMVCFSSSAAHMVNPVPESAVAVFNSVKDNPAGLVDNLLPLCTRGPGSTYMFSKMFVRYYVQMNAMRFGNKGCRINCISPGFIWTPMHRALLEKEPHRMQDELDSTPFHRYGAAFEISNLAEYLCGSGASYINGFDILMDGGQLAASKVPQLD